MSKSQPVRSGDIPAILRESTFLLGAAKPSQFPQDELVEIAFAGRSNVGKSSAINALTGHRKLARTSKTPGRTQQINFFTLGPQARLVDLPGYGFAQVPLAVKKEWQKTIHDYLSTRPNLIVLVLLMDIRHPMTDLDVQMVEWARDSNLPTQVLLTKSDKLPRGRAASTALKVEKQLEAFGGQFGVEQFSSVSQKGVALLRNQIREWVEDSTA